MSSEQFTMDDAENDGKIKREAGTTMKQVLSREGGELFEMFLQVCEDRGVQPEELLGDGIVRAVKQEDFADRIANVDINMSKLKKGSLRKEDARLLREFANELDLDGSGSTGHWLKPMLKDRLESTVESPLSGLDDMDVGGGETDPQLKREIQELKSQLNVMQQQIAQQDGETVAVEEDTQSVDDIFEESEEEPEEEDSDDGGLFSDYEAAPGEPDEEVTEVISSEDGEVEDE